MNYEEALKQVAQVGYKSVETCGFCGHTAQEVDALMKKYGLEVLSIHTWWDQALPDPDGVIADCKVLNCKNAVIPAANLYTREGIEEFIRLANIVQPKFEAAGIRLGYHNHAQEFTICGEPGTRFLVIEGDPGGLLQTGGPMAHPALGIPGVDLRHYGGTWFCRLCAGRLPPDQKI